MKPARHTPRWAKHTGAALIVFFTIKGLAWLAVGGGLVLAMR